MCKLIPGTFKSKEWANNHRTPKCKTDSKFLGHQHHSRKENSESKENKKYTAGKEQTKVHKRFSRRNSASSGLEAPRKFPHTFWNPVKYQM